MTEAIVCAVIAAIAAVTVGLINAFSQKKTKQDLSAEFQKELQEAREKERARQKYNGWPKTGTTTAKKTVTEAQLRQSVADIINSWLGAKEGDSVHAEILRIYNAQNPLPVGYKMQVHDAWCAATVSAAWLKAGIAQYTGTECGCGRFRDDAIKRGIWVEDDAYKPKIGGAVIYYWSDNGIGDCTTGADHIGLVTAVSGNSFTRISLITRKRTVRTATRATPAKLSTGSSLLLQNRIITVFMPHHHCRWWGFFVLRRQDEISTKS